MNILGTIYHVWYQPMLNAPEDSRFDESAKDIYIRCDNVRNVKDFKGFQRKLLQKEIIKAFAVESGIEYSENLFSWLTCQFDKIIKVYKDLELLGD